MLDEWTSGPAELSCTWGGREAARGQGDKGTRGQHIPPPPLAVCVCGSQFHTPPGWQLSLEARAHDDQRPLKLLLTRPTSTSPVSSARSTWCAQPLPVPVVQLL
ncbi:hypothetical protein COCCADRAFT_23339 [Bipolaris zeicola 26-R-13]|uniref:Uncharacterized protein n=1 Tax=Cochliobolus carbonum (strain 26-R-13) TaxID=930089 RepID=W6YGS5_COCC2|nr:uncharacterized protein COCCADRAFT_23339 [Bipolaris zeicola 26-R-13]EUC36898.1 hypothetical protein COCCADRAFT_23339 [Bipolaris zeicola 26-R-13]